MVELKMLPGEATAATRFLQSRLGEAVKVQGNTVVIDDARTDNVKLLLKKFLHREGLADYRVISEDGMLKISLEEKKQSRQDSLENKVKGVPPFPPLSSERLPLMQTVYPNYSSEPMLPPLIKKTKGRK
ncbi:MAG TPA: hypothetical protein VFE96_07885 [Candidatus Bathyarchaeia archaeon]|jgi:hypothetical protein|nr:hypothetical protein [Candidatus Bathyarchaeia archaeon]